MNYLKILAIHEWEIGLPAETLYLLHEIISAGHYEVIKSWLEYIKLSENCEYYDVTKTDVYNYLIEADYEIRN